MAYTIIGGGVVLQANLTNILKKRNDFSRKGREQ